MADRVITVVNNQRIVQPFGAAFLGGFVELASVQADRATQQAGYSLSYSLTSQQQAGIATAKALIAQQGANDSGAYLNAVRALTGGSPTSVALTIQAASRTILAAVANPAAGTQAYLGEPGREGPVVFLTGNQAANVSADPDQSIWLAPTAMSGLATDGSQGAWKRVISAGVALASWAGVVAGVQADQAPALKRLLANPAVSMVLLPTGTIYVGRAVMIPSGKALYGQGIALTTLKVLAGFFYDTNDAVQASNNAVVYGMRGALNVRTGDYSIDGSKVGTHLVCGVTMFNCSNFLVERVSSQDCSGYARWAVSDGSAVCNGRFTDQYSENANVHYETTGANGVYFERCIARDGDGDIDCEAVFHPYSSSNVFYIDCDGQNVAGAGILIGNYATAPAPDMVNIQFIRCRVNMTANPGPVALAVNGFTGGIRGIRIEDCDLFTNYIAVNVGSDSGKTIEIALVGGSITGETEIVTMGPKTLFHIEGTLIRATGGSSPDAVLVPLNISPDAQGTIDAPVFDLPRTNVQWSTGAKHRVVANPVYINPIVPNPIGPGHKVTVTQGGDTVISNGVQQIGDATRQDFWTFNGCGIGSYRLSVQGTYYGDGASNLEFHAYTGGSRRLQGEVEVQINQYGGDFDRSALNVDGSGIVARKPDAANSSRFFRASALYVVTAQDGGLTVQAGNGSGGTLTIEQGSTLTLERVA